MNPEDVIRVEIRIVREIISRECWFAGERRGCPVPKDDPEVVEKVCEILIETGEDLYRWIVENYGAA